MNKENELNELAKSLELINENKQKKNGKINCDKQRVLSSIG